LPAVWLNVQFSAGRGVLEDLVAPFCAVVLEAERLDERNEIFVSNVADFAS
jgi:hypothetical protein